MGVDRLSPIDRLLKRPQASETQQPKAEDPDAGASGRAIGDNGSTLQDAGAGASGGAIGDNGSTMEKTLTLGRRLTSSLSRP